MAAQKVNQVIPKKATLKPMGKRKKPGHGDGSILSDKIRKVVKDKQIKK